MSDREDFLSRWSRRKRDVVKESGPEEETKQPPAAASVPPTADEAAPAQAADVSESTDDQDKKEKEKDEPAFDLSKLPDLDSITAETDIRPFMAAGVPPGLRQAALRQVWVADPAIRDFIGIAENQWDFTPGGNAPGFDFSPPVGDVARMVADIFGGGSKKLPPELVEPEDKSALPEDPKSVRLSDDAPEPVADQLPVKNPVEDRDASAASVANAVPSTDASTAAVQEQDVALQKKDLEENEIVRVGARRSHGGAMPK